MANEATKKVSRDIYRKLVAEGKIKRSRLDLYNVLLERGPLTQHEAWKALCETDDSVQQRSITPRFAELERIGLVYVLTKDDDPNEALKRKCRFTGVSVSQWDVTGKEPVVAAKKSKSNTFTKGQAIAVELDPSHPLHNHYVSDDDELKWVYFHSIIEAGSEALIGVVPAKGSKEVTFLPMRYVLYIEADD